MNQPKLSILIVEDEAILAFGLEQDLIDAGHTTVGPYRDVETAHRAVLDETFDIAILDINLNGKQVYPVAEELTKRGIPFLFLSGYGGESIPERFRGFPRLAKPYDPAEMVRVLEKLT